MIPYSHIFFDLDGTLTDPGTGITNSVMYALERFGIHVEDRTRLYPFIGPPLLDSFQQLSGLSEQQARQAVGYYREYFSVTGIFENAVYPGIPEMLEDLRAAGKILAVATGKPEEFAKRILFHFHLDGFFSVVAGATMDEKRTRKDQVIRYALEKCASPDPRQVLMVGDREHDVLGAAKVGMDAMGVLYGYGSRQELMRAGAKYLAASVPEVASAILCPENDSFAAANLI